VIDNIVLLCFLMIAAALTPHSFIKKIAGAWIFQLLYVNPTGANPTGTVLSENRRRQVYKLAQIYDFLIVEDDPYCHIYFSDKQPTSFLSLDTDGRVIRLDSFSKIISSGLRLGAVTAGKKIISVLEIHMSNSVLHASALSQVKFWLFSASLIRMLSECRIDNNTDDEEVQVAGSKFKEGRKEFIEFQQTTCINFAFLL